MKPLRVGLVGCGEIAQIMHLPILADLPRFDIGAVCDLSPTVLDAVGERYGVSARYTDYLDLVAQPDLDIVAVLTMDHFPVAQAAIAAGKHVFVEKPLTFSPAEARELVAQAEAANVLLMVGYMKVYDPGFEYAAEYISGMQDVRHFHIRDFTGVFDSHAPLYDLVRGTDIPPDIAAVQPQRILDSIETALGPDHAHNAVLFRKLLMLCSHDFAVMRAAFGSPSQVLFTDQTHDWGITAMLDYGNGRRGIFEGGSWAKYPWFHQQLVAYGRDEIVTVEFSPPFTKHVPAKVWVERGENGRYVNSEVIASHDQAFRREWVHFGDCIDRGITPRTDGAGAVRDLELAVEMVTSLPVPTRSGDSHHTNIPVGVLAGTEGG
jgi:predicted dehydrogenase